MALRNTCAAIALLLCACGGGGSGDSPTESPPVARPPTVVADITLLFMGNSHTASNNLSTLVADMVRFQSSGRSVGSAVVPGYMFLEDHAHDATTVGMVRSQSWSFVILQAQKYSTSGQFSYPTDGAKELIQMSRQQRAVPIMFPEWPRLGVDETARIYDLHVSIAQQEAACVAPIGQAWDLALARDPALTLHAADGNHAAPAGTFLAALVLYATITGRSPLDLPQFPQYPVDAATQTTLRGIAAETVQTLPPRMWCPGDAV